MRTLKTILATLIFALVFASCNKAHYDVSNVHGINAEGEALLPIASKSYTVMDLMEYFEIQDKIEWTESGDMTFRFDYENLGVVDGADMLKFKDFNYEENYVFVNQYQDAPPPYNDTIVSFERAIVFDSEHIHVMQAQMKPGRLEFTVTSNFGRVQRVVLHSDNILDESGNDFELDIPVYHNTFGFDLEGLHYVSDMANTLNLSYDLYIRVHHTSDPTLNVDFNTKGENLAFSQMQGYVDTYSNRNSIDTVFTLFPGNLSGTLDVEGIRVKVSERNTFGLGARLVVDTAYVYSEGQQPYSIFEPLPLSVDLPPQLGFREVLDKGVDGQINAMEGRTYTSSNFIVNPEGLSGIVTVFDTNRIDTRVGVEVPFSFAADDIVYLDTADMSLEHLEMPEMIEKLTLELTITSTLPLDLKGSFFMFDSENDRITDTLLMGADIIQASYNGKPVKTDVMLVIDGDRVEKALHSDRIIMSYLIDSEARDVVLNVNQRLDLFLKVRAKYDGNIDI